MELSLRKDLTVLEFMPPKMLNLFVVPESVSTFLPYYISLILPILINQSNFFLSHTSPFLPVSPISCNFLYLLPNKCCTSYIAMISICVGNCASALD